MGAGKSGSFFIHSHDNKFVIKTMTKGELKIFLSIFHDYCEHFRNNRDSLIAKILGVFKVRCGKMGAVYVMLMENTLQLRDKDELKYIFDLKGSLVDRKV